MDLSKYEFILLVSEHPHKDANGKFTKEYCWQISTTSNNFTVTFNENRYHSLRRDAEAAARKFAAAYNYRIKK